MEIEECNEKFERDFGFIHKLKVVSSENFNKVKGYNCNGLINYQDAFSQT